MASHDLADLPADLSLSPPETLADGYRRYQRFRLELRVPGGAVQQTRDIIRGGGVVAVLPVDLTRDEIVLIRQFRLAGHLANGHGEMIEIVAGRVEPDEEPAKAAHRECVEEIGVAPARLVELFSYLTTPGITDEVVTIFAAAVDTSHVPGRGGAPAEGEQIETLRVPIGDAIAAIDNGRMHNGPMLMALQWLAINRGRLGEILG